MTQPMEVNDKETGAVMNMDKATAAGRCHTVSQALSTKTVSQALSAKTVSQALSTKTVSQALSAKIALDVISQSYSTRNTQQDTLNYTSPLRYTQPNTRGQTHVAKTHLAKEMVPVQRA